MREIKQVVVRTWHLFGKIPMATRTETLVTNAVDYEDTLAEQLSKLGNSKSDPKHGVGTA